MFKISSPRRGSVGSALGSSYLALTGPLLLGMALSLGASEAVSASPGAGHKLQVKDPALAQQLVAQGARLIADYGTFQVVQVPPSASVPTGPAVENRDDSNLIQLNTGALDTSKPAVQALRQSLQTFPGKRLHLIQFAGPVKPEWREQVVSAGVQIITYLPENAYLVYGDAASLARVQALPLEAAPLQWDGQYQDSYKIDPSARLTDASGAPRSIGTDCFAIQMVADAEANAATLQVMEQYKLAPVLQQKFILHYLNVIVRLPADKLETLAARPEIISIQPYFTPTKFCERQDQIVAGNLIGSKPSGPGYLGWLASKGFTKDQFETSGFVVDVSDSGLDNGTITPNHSGLYSQGDPVNPSRVAYARLEGEPNSPSTLKGCDGHGTLNAHIVGGYSDQPAGFPHTDTAGYHYGLGVCPFVKVGSSVIFDPNFTSPDFSGLQSRSYRDGGRVSNNSWGTRFSGGRYSVYSQEYDLLVRDAQPAGSAGATPGNQEMVIVFAAGNDGSTSKTVSPPGTAKNVITVGASENVQAFGGPFGGYDLSGCSDFDANSADDLADFSSRGPCLDGRHKPEIMAPGTHVSGGVAQASNPDVLGTADDCFNATGVSGGAADLSTDPPVGAPFFPDGQEFYTASSGTSHAAPCVAGGCALVRQYFVNNYSVVPSPAMTKAFLVNSARYLNGAGAKDSLWSDSQGMGEMNLGTAFDGSALALRDQRAADLFTASGQIRVFYGSVVDPSKPFRVTLAWTDAPGSTAGNAYNNNLDLVVTIGGVSYKGNVFSGPNSIPGGTADARNNLESVFLPAGVSGQLSITVTAANINSDGVPNNSTPLDQDFALVAYNVVFGDPPTINQQPASQKLIQGQTASFTVTASGASPLAYQWFKNGGLISGATKSTFAIANITTASAGVYSVMVTNSYGALSSADAVLTVVPVVALPYALNNSNLIWTTDSATPWYGQTTFSKDGAAGESYFIGANQQSSLRTTVTGPGMLTFWWQVSSQTNADYLSLTDNATLLTRISGEVDWQSQVVYLGAGSHTVAWVYSKNGSGDDGMDSAWVDQIAFTSGASLPFILQQPADRSAFVGTPVQLSLVAAGTPTLQYQWRLNGTNLPGATKSVLAFAAARIEDGGTYSVVVTNDYGEVISSNAVLGVVPTTGGGDNSFGQGQVPSSAVGTVAVAAGAYHSLALKADGQITAWGNGWNGQCDVPASLQHAAAIAAGGYHSLALKANGTVVGWGANDFGQATPPPGLSNVTAIAAGAWHSLALRADGTVVAWGDNGSGQANVPAGLTNVVSIVAAGEHSLALRANGTVVAWGQNSDAVGRYVGQSAIPAGLTNILAIGAGDYHSLVVKGDGTLFLWGDNSEGQCRPPAGLNNVKAVAGGGAHNVALKKDGTVVAWGDNINGQCDLPAGLTNVVAIAAGEAHTLVLVSIPLPEPWLQASAKVGDQFSVQVQTFAGKRYTLEWTSSLPAPSWTTAATALGDGSVQTLVDASVSGSQRFYRVRQY